MSLFVNPIDYAPTLGKVRRDGRQEITFVDTNQTKRTIDSTKDRIDEYVKIRQDNGVKMNIGSFVGGILCGLGGLLALRHGGKKAKAAGKPFTNNLMDMFGLMCITVLGCIGGAFAVYPHSKKRIEAAIKNLEVPDNEKNKKADAEEIKEQNINDEPKVKQEKEAAAGEIKEVNEIKKEIEEVKAEAESAQSGEAESKITEEK